MPNRQHPTVYMRASERANEPPRNVYVRGKRKRERGERSARPRGQRARAKRWQFGALCSLIAFNYTCPAPRSAAIATLYARTAKLPRGTTRRPPLPAPRDR